MIELIIFYSSFGIILYGAISFKNGMKNNKKRYNICVLEKRKKFLDHMKKAFRLSEKKSKKVTHNHLFRKT
jgi:hypothetical protein